MRSFAVLSLIAGAAYALPQAANSCVTVSTEVIVPTKTYTFTSTPVTTISATTAENLGTFTLTTTESSTITLETLTSTSTDCTASGTVTALSTSTVYTTSGATASATPSSSSSTLSTSASSSKSSSTSHSSSSTKVSKAKATTTSHHKRALGLYPRQESACTVTSTYTTTYGVTETYVAATATSTFTHYTAFAQATVTSTVYGGTAYAIATATATASGMCGTTVTASSSAAAATVTQDARCAPSALISEYDGYGLEYASDVPAGGASFTTTTSDGSQCCQLCAEAEDCAASSWDIRTGTCKLEFPVTSGQPSCGEGLLAYYDAGPDSPMAAGTGLYVAALCGNVQFGSAAPDNGS